MSPHFPVDEVYEETIQSESGENSSEIESSESSEEESIEHGTRPRRDLKPPQRLTYDTVCNPSIIRRQQLSLWIIGCFRFSNDGSQLSGLFNTFILMSWVNLSGKVMSIRKNLKHMIDSFEIDF